MSRHTLRVATSGDATDVAALYLASRRTFLPYAPLAYSNEAIAKWIASVVIPKGDTTVAVASGAIQAFCTTSIDDEGIAWIDQLYAAPGATAQGAGTALLAHALASLPRPVRLFTFQANEGARRFYERYGFKAIEFGDGSGNEERCPDVLYELAA